IRFLVRLLQHVNGGNRYLPPRASRSVEDLHELSSLLFGRFIGVLSRGQAKERPKKYTEMGWTHGITFRCAGDQTNCGSEDRQFQLPRVFAGAGSGVQNKA